jgi:hypothetical protein
MDNGNVIVGSLPRTGSAWLTAALNMYEDAYFLHDATLQYHNPFSYLRDCPYGYAGIVGTDAMLPMFDEVEANRVYLYRDVAEIARSTSNLLNIPYEKAYSLADECVALGESWCEKHEPYVIPYTELFEEKSFGKLWNHIFGDDVEWDKMRQIMALNIQKKPPSAAMKTLIGL